MVSMHFLSWEKGVAFIAGSWLLASESVMPAFVTLPDEWGVAMMMAGRDALVVPHTAFPFDIKINLNTMNPLDSQLLLDGGVESLGESDSVCYFPAVEKEALLEESPPVKLYEFPKFCPDSYEVEVKPPFFSQELTNATRNQWLEVVLDTLSLIASGQSLDFLQQDDSQEILVLVASGAGGGDDDDDNRNTLGDKPDKDSLPLLFWSVDSGSFRCYGLTWRQVVEWRLNEKYKELQAVNERLRPDEGVNLMLIRRDLVRVLSADIHDLLALLQAAADQGQLDVEIGAEEWLHLSVGTRGGDAGKQRPGGQQEATQGQSHSEVKEIAQQSSSSDKASVSLLRGGAGTQEEGQEEKNPDGNDDRSADSVTNHRTEFEKLVDQFLAIPESYYIKPYQDFRKDHKESFSKLKKEGSITDGNTFKFLLDMAIFEWFDKHDKNITRDKIVRLQMHAIEKNIDLSGYFKTYLVMADYRRVLNGLKPEDRETLLEYLHTPIFPKKEEALESLKAADYSKIDLSVLQVLFYFGVLPGFEKYVNYEMGFFSLHIMRNFIENLFFMISPVSFSCYDHARYGVIDSLLLAESFEKGGVGQYLQIILETSFFNKREFSESDISALSRKGFYFKMYDEFSGVINDFISFRNDLLKGGGKLGELNRMYQKNQEAMDSSLQKKCQTGSDFFGLFAYFQSETIRFGKRKNRTGVAERAKLFADAAQYPAKPKPSHWYQAYVYYRQATMWEAAGRAAQQYSEVWQNDNRMLEEYWRDESLRMKALAQEKVSVKPLSTGENYDLEAVLRRLEKEGVIKKDEQILSTSAIPQRPVNEEKGITETEIREEEAKQKFIQERLKRSQSSLWHREVKPLIRLIHKARDNSDLEAEERIFQGVNRIDWTEVYGRGRFYEEEVWKELRKFDAVFKTGIVPSSLREKGREWLNDAKKSALNAWGYYLGWHEVNDDIKPEAIYKMALELLESPEFQPEMVNQEARIRFRYLFSTLGHVYSMLAWVVRSDRRKYQEYARKCYGYKEIDPTYNFGWQKAGNHDETVEASSASY